MSEGEKTLREESVPPISSGSCDLGGDLLESGQMQPPRNPGTLGTIGRYPILGLLGEGGIGRVLLAREPVTDSNVAVQVIRPDLVRQEWAVHRFLTEARHVFKMSHASIVRLFEVSDRMDGPFFVMPHMAGGSLGGKLKAGEPMTEGSILPVARAVAEALQYAHARGIIHRNLKPSNVLFDAEGRAYLADFGLLRTTFNASMAGETPAVACGTMPYFSPAAAEGQVEDTRCDIYAFGCLLYEMLTGRPPYAGTDAEAILKQVRAAPPRPIRELNPRAPTRLAAIAEHAMARELRNRYASMGDIVRDLARVAGQRAPLGPRGSGRSASRRLGLAAVLTGALAAAFMVARLGTSEAPAEEHEPGEERWIDLGDGVTLPVVWIPATTSAGWKRISGGRDYFLMGDPESERAALLAAGVEPDHMLGETRHPVTLTRGFWMGKYEVTQEQWHRVMGWNPSRFTYAGKDAPVESVTWHDGQSFLRTLTLIARERPQPAGFDLAGAQFDLPTSAEREFACRAGTETALYNGSMTFLGQRNIPALDDIAWYGGNCSVPYAEAEDVTGWSNTQHKVAVAGTHPVGLKKPNAWGLHDMCGNVSEWCADYWSAEDSTNHVTDPRGPATGTYRITRGSAWRHLGSTCRSAAFDRTLPSYWSPGVGLRVVLRTGLTSTNAYRPGVTVRPPADPTAGREMTVDLGGGVSLPMVWIPPTTSAEWKDRNGGRDHFLMGSPADEPGRGSDETRHPVWLTRGFWMGRTEVTQAQWERVMGSNPSQFAAAGQEAPVDTVHWHNAQTFCRLLNTSLPPASPARFGLPTEAEWEYAARAGATSRFCAGDSEGDLSRCGWHKGNTGRMTHRVAQREPNAWGLFDVLGNVWEWCEDYHGPYPEGPVDDPRGPPAGSLRVVRGFSFGNAPEEIRLADRLERPSGYRVETFGFRVVLREDGATPLPAPPPLLAILLTFEPDTLQTSNGVTVARNLGGPDHGGALTGTSPAQGIAGAGRQFDGIQDAVNLVRSEAIDWGTNVTLALWIRCPPQPASVRRPRLISQSDFWKAQEGFALSVLPDRDQRAKFAGFLDRQQTAYPEVMTDAGVLDGQWHHIAATADGLRLRLYVDGTLAKTTYSPGAFVRHRAPMTIGNGFDGRQLQPFPGTIDEVAVLNRTFSEVEIRRLYELGRGGQNLKPEHVRAK